MRLLCVAFLALLLTACYEERIGCTDPDSANYDLQADAACPDCCTYPALSVRLTPVWGADNVVVGQSYADGAGNTFQLVRFRYYLGDLGLLSPTAQLPLPNRPVNLGLLEGVDTVTVTLNGNYLLASLAPTTTNVGTLRTGTEALDGLYGTYGLPGQYRTVVPATAPTGDALRTQPGRLNFRDGQGYVQTRLEYTLVPGGDTLSVSSYGSRPFILDFGQAVTPAQGFNLRLDVEARLDLLLGNINLAADSAAVAEALDQEVDFLFATGLVQQ
ncbi:hypothetical protein [Lewinella sp. IMCC34183]|uniref:hypothetical protein n=1 Tax=Lewinella sp. IMCC34183 TaxID=2248762 RepID=UPI000E241CD5|nr:hypothetical protein [Lewinella sp. IMCC34183]